MAVPKNHPDPNNDVEIDEQAISDLMDSLNRLKKTGGRLKRDEIWVKHSGNNPLSSLEPTSTKDTLYADISYLQALQRVKSALDILAGSVEATIIARRKEILPVSRNLGLLSLPPDIFLYIFQQIMDSYADTFEGARTVIRDLSLVNRQFRSMVIEFTNAWAFLDLNRCRGEAHKQHIRRSKKAPLSVRFVYEAEMQLDIGIVLAHKQRWKHLDVAFYYNELDEHADIINDLPSMDFPSVRSICLKVAYGLNNIDFQMFSKWTFPNAKVVKMVNGIPNAGSLKFEAATSFEYIGTPLYMGDSGSFNRQLTDFLRVAVNLRSVYLDISHIRDLKEQRGSLMVVLPSVTDFTITNWRQLESGHLDFDVDDRPSNLVDFARLMRIFWIPNVENISISIAFFEDELELEYWVPLAFSENHDMEAVSRLSFNVQWYPDDEETPRLALKVDEFLRRFPTLEVFSIDAGDCGIIIECEVPHNLKSLRIDNCDNPPDNLYWILQKLATTGPALNELKINSKFVLSHKELEKIFFGADIQVTSSPRYLSIWKNASYSTYWTFHLYYSRIHDWTNELCRIAEEGGSMAEARAEEGHNS